MIEPLPPELEALFAAERAAPLPNAAIQSAVRAQITSSVGHVPLGSVAASVGLKLKLVLALAVATGGGVAGYKATRPESAVTAPAVHGSAASEVSARLEVERPTPIVQHEAVDAVINPDPPPPMVRATRAPVVDVSVPNPADAALLTSAWHALSAHDANRALELLAQASKLSPRSPLEEERHALAAAALDAAGRHEEATRVATLFVEKYPHSVHVQRIRRVLQPEDSR